MSFCGLVWTFQLISDLIALAKGGGKHEQHHRGSILRQYSPAGARLPKNWRIRAYPAVGYAEREKTDRNTDRGVKRNLRKVQGQHIRAYLHDRGHSVYRRLQAGSLSDSRGIHQRNRRSKSL